MACSGMAQRGTVATMRYVLAKFPYCRSMGIYNCRNVAGSSSLSKHSCGRALDPGIPTLANGKANTELGYPVVQFFDRFSTAFGVEEQIYDRVIYDDASPRGRYYGGVHPHNDHNHVSQSLAKAKSLTYEAIVAFAGPPTPEGDDMLGFNIGRLGQPAVTSQQAATLQLLLNDRGANLTVDSAAGDLTRNALTAFQTREGIGPPEKGTGVIAPYTYAALFSPGSGGLNAGQVDAKIATHAKGKASGTVHPHGHDEGATGPPV